MAQQAVEVPTGYTLLPVLVPTSRVQDYIDTYAKRGGYDPTIHGASAAQKTTFAKEVLASQLDTDVISYKSAIAVATAMVDQKTQIL